MEDTAGASNIYYFIIIFLFFLSAFFSSAETAISAANKIKVQKNKKLVRLLELPDKYISTLLIGNNIVNTAISVLITKMTLDIFGNKWLAVITAIFTVFLIIFGEIIPKTIATYYPEKILKLYCFPITIVYYLLIPLVWIINNFTSFLFNLLNLKKEKEPVTKADLNSLIEVGEKTGVLEEEETDMLHGIINFSDKTVKDIIKTYRTEIVGIPIDCNYSEFKNIVNEHQFSRYPVYKDNMDNILGIVHIKDVFRKNKIEEFNIKNYMIDYNNCIFIPETLKVKKLFEKMKQQKCHIAIVVEECGGTLGLITLEDILEVIVGEIEDESDLDENKFIKYKDDKKIVVDASISLTLLNEIFETNFYSEQADTMSGLIFEILGEFPHVGCQFEYQHTKFTVLNVSNKKIEMIKLEKL